MSCNPKIIYVLSNIYFPPYKMIYDLHSNSSTIPGIKMWSSAYICF